MSSLKSKLAGLFIVAIAATSFCTPSLSEAGVIQGSGLGGNGTRDAFWEVVASHSTFTPPDGQTYPYAAYTLTDVPSLWVGSTGFLTPQAGVTIGGETYRWIGPVNAADSTLPFPEQYRYIFRQAVSVAPGEAGAYDFTINAAGDNFFEFYINGTIDYTDPKKPTITGGTQIGSTVGGLDAIKTLTGMATLNVGTNYVYGVVEEHGFHTGMIIAKSSFAPSAVPEPCSCIIAGFAVGGYAASRWRGRKQGVKGM